ncbi:hypothetical protein Tco_1118809, partial [Tanacetum coccineum]
MEYLVKVSKRCAFWSLNEDILKITILKTNTPYPSKKIWRIRACTHQRPQRREDQYAVTRRSQYDILKIEYVNILEDIKCGPYSKKPPIRLIQSLGYAANTFSFPSKIVTGWTIQTLLWRNTSGSRKRKLETIGKCLTWKLLSMVTSAKTLSREPTVSSLNNEIDFRISFDDSDDEDYTVIFEKNLFLIKKISTNDMKTDLENDNEKVNLPSLLSPEPAINLSTEPILNPRHIDEFDLNDETSLSEYDEEEQNVLYFNDLFPFNIICPDDLKSEKDNDDNDIDTIYASIYEYAVSTLRTECLNFYNLCAILVDFTDMALPLHEQRHPFLRYEGLQYSDTDIIDFESRLARIYQREVHRVQVFDLGELPDLMAEGLSARMLMEQKDAQGAILDLDTLGALQFQLGEARRHMSWRQFILALGLQTNEEMQTSGFGISSVGDFLGIAPSYTVIRDPILKLCHRLIACSIAGRSQAPEKVTMTDLFYLRGMDVDSVNVPYLLARYLRLFAAGRKSGAHISGGQFVARLAEHFGLLTAKILGGLTVIAPELLIIDMAELVRLQICEQLDDTWAWVAMGPERHLDAAAGALGVVQDAPVIDEGGQGNPAPVQASPPQATARTMPQRMDRLEEDVHDIRRTLVEQRE